MGKEFTVTKEGLPWASEFLGRDVEEGDTAEFNLVDKEQETAVVAAGWLEPAKTKGGK